MYILTIIEDKEERAWFCFDTLEAGREFLNLFPGYANMRNAQGEVEREWIDTAELSDYDELVFRGKRVPISKQMFRNRKKVEIYFREVPCLTHVGEGLVDGTTLVDAYIIPNNEVKDYIEQREKTYLIVRNILAEKQIETDRWYQGSQDGEAVVYRHLGESDWHFLWHMDPSFVDLGKQGEESVRAWLDDLL